MPPSVNLKALAARERKIATQQSEKLKRIETLEAKKWEDDDKLINRKNERRTQTAQKNEDRTQRKQELRKLAEEEFNSTKCGPRIKNQAPTKLTRAEILQRQLLSAASAPSQTSSNGCDSELDEIQPNYNRLLRQETLEAAQQGKALISASSLNDAIAALSLEGDEKNPERRMRAAFRAYEETAMPRLKMENPTLKRSQLIELLHKQWKKAPETPMNGI